MRVAALLLFAALAGCARPLPQAATERPYPAIVSLNPCSDAVLAEVARPGQLLAISHYSHSAASSSMDLAKAAQFPAVSGSAEDVLALRPDIVVADPFLAPATRAALKRSGIRIVSVPIARTAEQSRTQVLDLARLAGNETAGVLLNTRIDAALASAAVPSGQPLVPAVVWQSGGIVPGRETLVSDLLARTGFVLQTAARGMRQADHLPLEALLADPPTVLLVVGDRRSRENAMLGHPALAALVDMRRADFDPSLLWCGGPTILRAVHRLAEVRSSL